ncbi:divergent polysaccharide deacetylase family protein [Micavibrio aeruginosavorus]|uniref:Divergent polysaccharide deacetylase family protein n=1 Tax=Micavibrio aeruginosavorus (strain ARL-13) TaxID=856793 RepID=G2KPL1_MICAA|nr:divergent polysaccharide deacetylase family protein [Micavibrio aeruginosavorus]AEP09511.1 divergent polysaccharide deacetylase family protein [Micavibrio aeruginosavorus ARL-13]
MAFSTTATGPTGKSGFPRAFVRGMAVVILIYALVAGWAWWKDRAELAKLNATLPQQTTVIVRAEKPATLPDATTPATEAPDDHAAAAETPVVTPEPQPAEATAAAIEPPVAGTAVEYMENGMAKAPITGLFQVTPDGQLPIVREGDRLRPFDAYRRPFRPVGASGAPIISILVNDVGISETLGTSVLKDLPPEISVAITPYATAPDQWMKRAREAGHEVWLKLPVESADYPLSDPGPQTLLINAIEKQNFNKLYWALSRGTGYVGVVTGREPAFIKSLNDMRPMINDIYHRGLGFVDGDIQPTDVPRTMAVGMDAPYASTNLWIDHTLTPEAIAAALTSLERTAANNGTAIGFVNANPLTLKALAEWAPTLQKKGLVLAPLSAATRMAK